MPFGFVPPPTPPASSATPPFSGGDVVGGYLVDNQTEIRDDADPTRLLRFELGGTTGTVVLTPPATAGTYTLATGSSWDPTAAETISNKTMTSCSFSSGAVVDSGVQFVDNIDPTKALRLQLSGITTATTRTLTAPDSNGTIALIAATQTLTNKTLTAPTINNALISDASTWFDNLDNTKELRIQVSGLTTGTTRTWTAPDANGTVVLESVAATLTNKTLGSTNTLTGATAASFTNGSGATISLPTGATARTLATLDGSEVLTNKGLVAPSITGIVGVSTAAGATITFPLGPSNQTLSSLDGVETLTNKTLTTPVIASITSGAVAQAVPSTTAGTLVNTTQAQTFATNPKTFGDGTLALRNPADSFSATLRAGAQTGTYDFTLPVVGANDTIVTADAVQTLAGKTLSAPIIGTIVNGAATQTVPSGYDGELMNTTEPQTIAITGVKTFQDGTLCLEGFGSGVAYLLGGGQSVDRSFTLPVVSGDDTFVTVAATQTLTNKTLTTPVIASITNGVAQAVPNGAAGTLVNTTQAQTFTTGAKTFGDGFLALRNPADTFSATLRAGAQTGARNFTMPVTSGDDTVVTLGAAQTLTNKTFTSPTITTPTISGAALIADTSAFQDDGDGTKRMAFQLSGLPTATTVTYTTPNANGALVIDTAAQTLTNKTLTTPVIASITNSVAQAVPSTTAGTLVNTTQAQTFITGVKTFNDGFLALRNPANTFSATLRAGAQTGARNFTLPVTGGDDTVVTLAATQTLTNKTLTAPVIASITASGSTQTLPTTTGTLLNTTQAALITTGVKTFGENILALRNPLNTASAVVNAGAQTVDRTFTFPVAASATIVLDTATQTITNKTFTDSTTLFADNTDATKTARFECSGITTGQQRAFTFPDVSSTLVTVNDVSSGATSIGATTPYSSLYLEDLLNVTRTDALSTTYRTYCEFLNPNDTDSWFLSVQTQAVGFSRLAFRYNNTPSGTRGYFSNVGPDTQVNHTMQHHLLLDDPSELATGAGLLFQRVDGSIATFTSRELETIKTGPSGIIVDDALPVMRLCPATRNCKGLYGVLCRPAPREWFGAAVGYELDDVPDIDSRGLFATQGEGALWVLAPVVAGEVPACYHIELGDFLSSCGFAAGYAGRQMSQADGTIDDADTHFSWSVARAGFSCDYDTASTAYTCENVTLSGVDYRRAFIPVGFCM